MIGSRRLIVDYADAARHAAETMKKDPIIFQVWPNFVALGEKLDEFRPEVPEDADQMLRMRIAYGRASDPGRPAPDQLHRQRARTDAEEHGSLHRQMQALTARALLLGNL